VINFRYHIVSLIAVFLALAIGVIMGSAVIDRAIVNRLEDQQRSLETRIHDVETENDALSAENRLLTESADQLAEQGGQRLLAGALVDVPVLVVATRDVDGDGLDGLVSLLGTAGADQRGTIWLTERFALDDDDEVRDLRGALDATDSIPPDRLRDIALTRLSALLRVSAGTGTVDDPSVTTTTVLLPEETTTTTAPADTDVEPTIFAALRDAGFIDFDAPEGATDDASLDLPEGTRVVLVSGRGAKVPVPDLAVPFAKLLVDERGGLAPMSLLAAEDRNDDETEDEELVVPLREDDDVAGRLSSVDNIDDFAGRLAAVLAIVDLGDGRVGHYGRGPGAQRLLPAPPENGG
jgi:hypothetical protein